MDFLSGLSDFLSSVASELLDVLVQIINFIINVFQFVWNVLQLIGSFLYKLLVDAGQFFGHLWANFLKGIFTNLLKGVVKFGQWLKGIFGPVVKFLRKASQYIDRIYNHYIRPLLRWIRVARVFLSLLKALHIKWATKLDNILGTIQTDIQRAFLTIKQYLNVVIDLLNILSDPTNLLRRPTTLLSLRRIWHAFIRQYTGLPPGFFFPSPRAGTPHGLGFLPANFDASNPIQNPPPSYYLAFDGGVPSFDFLGPGDTIPDDSIDTVQPDGFFSADFGLQSNCDDPDLCMAQAVSAVAGGA